MAGTWQRLAHVALSGSGDVLDSGTFTAKKNMKVIINTIATGGNIKENITFNSDTGNNYARRRSNDGASDSTDTSQPQLEVRGDEANDRYITMDIINNSSQEKLVIGEYNIKTDGAGNAPSRSEWVGKWANTSAQITKITVTNTGSGSYDTGSYITVLGASDDIITDEKQTLADATSDTTLVAGTSDITDLTWTQTVGSSTSDTFYVLKDTSNDLMDIKAAGNCGAESSPSIAYATLSEALGTAYWRMRFKLVFNTVTAESTGGKSFFTNFFIVDSGTSSSSVGSENGFGFKFIADAGSTQTQFYATTNGTDSGTSMSWTPASGNTIYVEISWEGGTATANFYSDSGYSNRVSSTTANATRSGTFSGLKFPQIALRQDNGGNGVMEIDMSNLEIINRVSTAPPVGTRYEETDTRKIYRRVIPSSPEATKTFTFGTSQLPAGANVTCTIADSGSKMYLASNSASDSQAGYQYTLSTAYDVSTASYASKTYNSWGSADIRGMKVKNSGQYFYRISDQTGNKAIKRFTASTAYDISTLGSSQSYTYSGVQSGGKDVDLDSTGTKMYALADNATVYQYTLSTAWQISSGVSSASKSFSCQSQDNAPRSFLITNSGTKLRYLGSQNNKLYTYTLSTAWDISTASYDGASSDIDCNTFTGNPYGVAGKDDGSWFVIAETDSPYDVQQFDKDPVWKERGTA